MVRQMTVINKDTLEDMEGNEHRKTMSWIFDRLTTQERVRKESRRTVAKRQFGERKSIVLLEGSQHKSEDFGVVKSRSWRQRQRNKDPRFIARCRTTVVEGQVLRKVRGPAVAHTRMGHRHLILNILQHLKAIIELGKYNLNAPLLNPGRSRWKK